MSSGQFLKMTKNYLIKTEKQARLDEILRQKLPQIIQKEISNSKIRRLIISGCVYVNKSQVRIPGFSVRQKAEISVAVDEEKLFFEKQPDDIKFEVTSESVIFEDDNIIIVNKPAFFPTEAGMVGSRDNLHAAVIRYLWNKNPSLRNQPYVGVMHRLDRETSGVILFTKSRAVNAHCHDMFENHTARKIYRAVALKNSRFKIGDEFSVEFPMGRVSLKSQTAKWGHVERSKGGLDSKTDFKIVDEGKLNGKSVFYIECKPLTGRTHQIRVHLSSVGMAIVGDELYGGIESKRIMLHAKELVFPFPGTKEMTVAKADFPDGFSGNN